MSCPQERLQSSIVPGAAFSSQPAKSVAALLAGLGAATAEIPATQNLITRGLTAYRSAKVGS